MIKIDLAAVTVKDYLETIETLELILTRLKPDDEAGAKAILIAQAAVDHCWKGMQRRTLL